MPLPFIGNVPFDNISGDIPRAYFDVSTFVVPGVDGTGTVIEGQRFTDQQFHCTAFCVDLASVIQFKNDVEILQGKVLPMTNSLGESWSACLILNATFPPDATIGCLAFNVPNMDQNGTVRPICRYKVDVEIFVRFLYPV